jgi:hypothetical protein
MEHDLHTSIKVINVCTEFDIFEVKVPIIFFGTPVFSARRDGRYLVILSSHFIKLIISDRVAQTIEGLPPGGGETTVRFEVRIRCANGLENFKAQ